MAAGVPITVTSEPKLSRPLVIGLGAGGGIAVLTVLLQLTGPEAKPLLDAVIHWGPLFVIVLLGMELMHSTVNNWGKQFVNAAITNATALQSMADAMQRISQRDDERERERELAFNHLAFTTQAILTKVEEIAARVPEQARAAKGDGGIQ